MHPSVRVCVFMGEGSKCRGLTWSKKKRYIYICTLTYLWESLCDSPCTHATDCLWSQKKTDWCFRTYALFSRMHPYTDCHVSNPERLSLFPSFIIERAHAHFNLTTWQFTTIWRVPFVEVDLIFSPIAVTWPVRLWPVLTLLADLETSVLKRSGRAPTNAALHTFTYSLYLLVTSVSWTLFTFRKTTCAPFSPVNKWDCIYLFNLFVSQNVTTEMYGSTECISN